MLSGPPLVLNKMLPGKCFRFKMISVLSMPISNHQDGRQSFRTITERVPYPASQNTTFSLFLFLVGYLLFSSSRPGSAFQNVDPDWDPPFLVN